MLPLGKIPRRSIHYGCNANAIPRWHLEEYRSPGVRQSIVGQISARMCNLRRMRAVENRFNKIPSRHHICDFQETSIARGFGRADSPSLLICLACRGHRGKCEKLRLQERIGTTRLWIANVTINHTKGPEVVGKQRPGRYRRRLGCLREASLQKLT